MRVPRDPELTAEERAQLRGDVSAILAKSGFERGQLLAEIRRAVAARQVPTGALATSHG